MKSFFKKIFGQPDELFHLPKQPENASKNKQFAIDWLIKSLDKKEGFPATIKHTENAGGIESILTDTSATWVDYYVNNALLIAYADYSHPLVSFYLDWALQLATLVDTSERPWRYSKNNVQEDKLEPYWNLTDKGRYIFYSSIAKKWHNNTELDNTCIKQAGEAWLTHPFEYFENMPFDAMMQSYFYEGVEYLLIAGDIAQAKQQFKTIKKGFVKTRKQHDWLKHFVYSLPNDFNEKSQPLAPDLKAHFDVFFNRVRMRNFESDATAKDGSYVYHGNCNMPLRLGLIRWKYIEQKPFTNNWESVIDQISK